MEACFRSTVFRFSELCALFCLLVGLPKKAWMSSHSVLYRVGLGKRKCDLWVNWNLLQGENMK